LLGPNGAGKSTLITMITTLIKPESGEIKVAGYDVVKEFSKVKEYIGLVPQEIALYPTLTAKENLDFWGKMYGLSGSHLKKRIDNVLETVGLTDRQKDKIKTYSGGMKRRINIAAALLHKPELLIMDEPTVGIDPQSRNHILETVLELNKEGMTVLYTSHYMEEVEFLCSRVAIMDYDKIIALGTKPELRKLISDEDIINIEAYNIKEDKVKEIENLSGILSVQISENNIKVLTKNADEVLASVISKLDSESAKIQSVKIDEPNLENVFLHLTGRVLRD
jgi:ABC-2 type transport system ATP-binding protein